MMIEPTLRDAALDLVVNAVFGACYAVILTSPLVFWVMTP